jgi:hypothetical protein
MEKAIAGVEQTLLDIAVQYCGSAEAVFELARLNRLSITDDLIAGQELLLPSAYNDKVVKVFDQNHFFPSVTIGQEMEGIDYDIIEVDLEVI